MTNFNLQGKVAVVTGASSGLGVQFAKALAEKGAKIALVARREEKLIKVKEEISKYNVECSYYQVDVTNVEQVKEMVDKVVKDFGRIDILVNNAGIATVEPTEAHDIESWNRVINTNLNGVFYCARYVGEVMVKQNYGKVEPIDYVAVVDCGTVINPKLARIQAEGGLVQGIGMALYEDVRYDSQGRMGTNDFMQYKIPTRKDIGNIRVEFEESYEPTGPFGAKSIGEIVINTPSPAIQEAVYHAVGARVTKLPITPSN